MLEAHTVRPGMDLATGTTRTGDEETAATRTGHEDAGHRREAPDRPGLRLVEGDARAPDPCAPDRPDHFVRRDGKVFAGIHLIIEVVDGHGLDDEVRIERAFRDCVAACEATVLHIHLHKFSPQGVSGVAVLAESHISVHTWPEIGYGAFDVFMCGDANPWAAVEVLREAFSAGEVRVREILRGEEIVAGRL